MILQSSGLKKKSKSKKNNHKHKENKSKKTCIKNITKNTKNNPRNIKKTLEYKQKKSVNTRANDFIILKQEFP